MPKSLHKEESTRTDNYAKFIAEPFESGYGHTVGNSLRRVLLSSLEGAAITSVKISGANHEFQTLPNVVEDVVDIILNLKKVKSVKPRITNSTLILRALYEIPVSKLEFLKSIGHKPYMTARLFLIHSPVFGKLPCEGFSVAQFFVIKRSLY